ncbi:MAG: hypothetical protein HY908_33960 [Myxococcales bacterium]|nr:hypothetical protein [Myxococcales bacterium]
MARAEPRPGRARVLCVGEILWDVFFDATATTRSPLELGAVPGGAAVNVALGLRRLGIASAVAGRVSDDALGRGLRDALRRAGVGVGGLVPARGRMGLLFVARTARGAASFAGYRPRLEPAPTTRPSARRERMSHLHVAALPPEREALEALGHEVDRARATGAVVSLDLNLRPGPWAGARFGRRARALVRAADLVKASVPDLALAGAPLALGARSGHARAVEAARRALGARTLVVTRGRLATLAAGPWGATLLSVSPERARFALGAGDALAAGLIGAIVVRGLPHDAATWRAALAAGHAAARSYLADVANGSRPASAGTRRPQGPSSHRPRTVPEPGA